MIVLAKNTSVLDEAITTQSSSLSRGGRSEIDGDVHVAAHALSTADVLEADLSADAYFDSPPRYSESEGDRSGVVDSNETDRSRPIVRHPDYLANVTVSSVPTGGLEYHQQAHHRDYDTHAVVETNHEEDAGSQVEWTEALKELRMNLTDLRNARHHASKASLLSRATPGYLRPLSRRGKKKSMHDADPLEGQIRVLEELVLQGMRRLARVHPSTLVQAEWATRAEDFERTLRMPADIDVHGLESEEGMETNARGRGRGRDDVPLKVSGGLFGDGFFPKLKDTDSHVALMMKGTGYVVLTPIVICGALVYGSLAAVYFSGKLVVKAGQKVVQHNDKP